MKVLFVATVANHITRFHVPFLRMFKEAGWETAVAARGEAGEGTAIPFCDAYYDVPFERSPLRLKNIAAYRELKAIIDGGRYDIIHCHTPMGAALTRLAASGARRRGSRVFYTAHGFHFYRGAPALNWLVYYPIERLLAGRTDVLITMNREDYRRARSLGAGRVEYVPGMGVDLDRFHPGAGDRAAKRGELGLEEGDFVLLSVGELSARKNHAAVLEAMARLRDAPALQRMRYLICGRGPLEAELRQKIRALGLDGRVRLLGKRDDVAQLCGCADLFVFMSRQEGLPMALMEAMACGLPVVCSRIRGNVDLVEDGVSGRVIDNSPRALAAALSEMAASPQERARLAQNALQRVSAFSLEGVEARMRGIYFDEQGGGAWPR